MTPGVLCHRNGTHAQNQSIWGPGPLEQGTSIAFAGAGCPAGAVIGATDKHGGEVTERLCTPYDYAATIYRKLGIPDSQRLEKPGGVTVNLTDGGTPIKELFG
ncbi:MAG: DUF1501 domain-containing protein [Verrucomicrobiales bacterium]